MPNFEGSIFQLEELKKKMVLMDQLMADEPMRQRPSRSSERPPEHIDQNKPNEVKKVVPKKNQSPLGEGRSSVAIAKIDWQKEAKKSMERRQMVENIRNRPSGMFFQNPRRRLQMEREAFALKRRDLLRSKAPGLSSNFQYQFEPHDTLPVQTKIRNLNHEFYKHNRAKPRDNLWCAFC